MLFYSESQRLIDAKKFNLILSLKIYYNLICKKMSDKNKLHIIKTLLLLLHHKNFIYHIKINKKK
jgi:hypothetical protein